MEKPIDLYFQVALRNTEYDLYTMDGNIHGFLLR